MKKGPVVLNFYRGAWCPVCNFHLPQLAKITPTIEEKYGASIIAITPQLTEKSKEQLSKVNLPFKVVSDLDDSITKAYKSYFEVTPELDSVYQKMGIDVKAFNGNERMGLPVPSTYIIDTNGVVKAMQADTNYMNRMGPDEIYSGLEEAKEGSNDN